MAYSITLRSIGYNSPDGKPLLADIDLVFGPVRTALVGRNGVGKTTLLRLIAGELFPTRGEVVANGTVAMLRQSVQTATGSVAHALGCGDALEVLERLETGHGLPNDANEADWTLPSRIGAALERVGLPALPPKRNVDTLSGGQLTRLGLAALILAEPDFLLLDEPTNSLDADGRAAVTALMGTWRGGVIVVSHDRAVLREVDDIVELTSLGTSRFGGNWDAYRRQKTVALAAAEQGLSAALRRVRAIERKAQQIKERKGRKDRTGKRKAGRGDMPRILLGARKETSEGTSGRIVRIAEHRRTAAESLLTEARAKVEVLSPLAVKLESSQSTPASAVLQFDRVTGGPLPNDPVIRDLSFSVMGQDRVAVVGPNGSGKSTLLRLASRALMPHAGMVYSRGVVVGLDQDVRLLDPALSIRENYLRLNPHDDENACRGALARLAFRADIALKQVGVLSGGELLRAGLACTIGSSRPPNLLILDEPTNHLDLEAIAAIESGLRAYDGALLLASHDEDFLEAVGISHRISIANPGSAPTAATLVSQRYR